jgi:hypothetical protein
MKEDNVRTFYRLFKEGGIKVHDEKRIVPLFGHGLFEGKYESRILGNTRKISADQSLRSDQETKDVRVVQKWLKG